MACPQLNSWRPGGEQDTEERSLASHREGDREWRKKREGGGKDRESERGEHWFYFSLTLKSPVKVSSSPSVTYTCMQLARWTHARCILQHVRWSLLWAFNWWRTKSPQWRQARERITGERERETDQHNTGKIRVSLMTQSTATLPISSAHSYYHYFFPTYPTLWIILSLCMNESCMRFKCVRWVFPNQSPQLTHMLLWAAGIKSLN